VGLALAGGGFRASLFHLGVLARLAEAVSYALNQWTELNVVAGDGAVPIDNNVSERKMKRIVLDRKNSLFVGNERGGVTAAMLSSLTSTCCRHGHRSAALHHTFAVQPADHTNQPPWLPDRWKHRQAPPAHVSMGFT
jgi:hypothetical protein